VAEALTVVSTETRGGLSKGRHNRALVTCGGSGAATVLAEEALTTLVTRDCQN